MEFPILIEPRRSRFFLVALCAFHSLAFLGIWTTPWEIVWRLGLSVPVIASFRVAFRCWRTLPRRLLLQPDGRLMVDENGDGRPDRAALLCPDAWALPALCVFSWQPDTAEDDIPENPPRRLLVFFPDSIEAESLRRLRVWLRTSRLPQTDRIGQ